MNIKKRKIFAEALRERRKAHRGASHAFHSRAASNAAAAETPLLCPSRFEGREGRDSRSSWQQKVVAA
jgi:hypothetical protein